MTQAELLKLAQTPGVVGGRDVVKAACVDLIKQKNLAELPEKLKRLMGLSEVELVHKVRFQNGVEVTSQKGMTKEDAARIANLPHERYFRVDPHDPVASITCQHLWRPSTLRVGSFIVTGHKPVCPSSRTLVIIGCARGWDHDLKKINRLGIPYDTMAVNGAGVHVPSKFWYSIHSSYLVAWEEYVKTGKHLISEFYSPGIHSCYAFYNEELARVINCGFSGNFAMLTALVMGYHYVILAGCPLDTRPVDPLFQTYQGWPLDVDTWTACNNVTRIQLAFLFLQKKYPEVAERVRSMSGYTKSVLGEPTPRWLSGEERQDAYRQTLARVKAEIGPELYDTADHPS